MYNILNWNTGLTEHKEESKDYIKIIEYVKVFLQKENAIAVLQQIPYKVKNSDNKWVFTHVYKYIEDSFKEKRYTIVCNNTYLNGHIFMQTIIITNFKTLSEIDNNIYPNGCPTNREAAIKIEDSYSILGLHAKNGDYNLGYIKSINGNADIILGDFNAGDYLKYSHWESFRNILPSHVCICNVPTKRVEDKMGSIIRETCIDHVFVRREYITRCSNVIVHNENKMSDHYPITFCIK
jgi:hypothetical protein